MGRSGDLSLAADGASRSLSPALGRGAARATVAALFRDVGIETADLDARVLVCAACGIDHAGLIRDPGVLLGPAATQLSGFAARRLAGEPVSRILGRRDFWGLSFAVTPAVLDPRPETEGLVGSILDAVGGRRGDPLRILDLGTGSGAILCALLHELPDATGIGIDCSLGACRVAWGNCASLGFGSRAMVVGGSWADAIGARFDVVVSNPPYIPHQEITWLDRDVREHDPTVALDGGADGLDPYRRIVPHLPGLLYPGGVAGFECGWNQGAQVVALMRGAGLTGVMAYRDLAGHDRVVVGTKSDASDIP